MARDWMSEWEDEKDEASYQIGQAFINSGREEQTYSSPTTSALEAVPQIKVVESVPALAHPQQSSLTQAGERPPKPRAKGDQTQLSIFDLPIKRSQGDEQQ